MFPEGVFRLEKWNSEQHNGVFTRLCDNYKVPLDPINAKQEIIPISEVQSELYSMGKIEEKEFEKSIEANKIHIKYREGIDMYVFGSSTHSYCEPVLVTPSEIPIQEVC